MITVYKNAIHDTQKVNLKDLGLSFLSFNVQSLSSELATEAFQGADGEYITDNQYKGRRIDAVLYYRKDNYIDFQNGKSEVYKLLNSKQKLLLVDNRLNTEKVWEVVVESDYTLDNEQTTYTKEFEITLLSESTYAHAIEYTKTPINDTEGIIYNAGDVYLDAREHDIEFTFKGKSDKLRIVNETTNTQWQYLGTTSVDDEIKVISTYPFKNGKDIFNDVSQFDVLEFATGSNKLKVYGADGNFTLNVKHRELFI